MSTGELQAVLFDMDGTLLDSEKLWEVGLQDLCAHLGGELSRAAREGLVGMDQTSSMWLVHRDLGLSTDGVDASAAWLETRMAELFAQGVVWRPGARELLAEVRAAGLPTALVTATVRRLVDVIIDTVGPENFDVTVCGDEVARNKPSPDPYLEAARALNVAPGACVAIEDSPTGTTSAREAGCQVLTVPSETAVPPAERVAFRESLIDVNVPLLRSLIRE
ncbi:MAG: HAD family hydrolase [Stackebrandtia sp.]